MELRISGEPINRFMHESGDIRCDFMDIPQLRLAVAQLALTLDMKIISPNSWMGKETSRLLEGLHQDMLLREPEDDDLVKYDEHKTN